MSNNNENVNVDTAEELSIEERNLRIQMCDYLFERGHRISKPLVDAAAHFAYDYGRVLYEQGKREAKGL